MSNSTYAIAFPSSPELSRLIRLLNAGSVFSQSGPVRGNKGSNHV